MIRGTEWISFEQMTRWSNMKASLAAAGIDGTCYEEFRPFSVKEIDNIYACTFCRD